MRRSLQKCGRRNRVAGLPEMFRTSPSGVRRFGEIVRDDLSESSFGRDRLQPAESVLRDRKAAACLLPRNGIAVLRYRVPGRDIGLY